MGAVVKGIGVSRPGRLVSSAEIDRYLEIDKGSTERRTGIKNRFYVNIESAAELGIQSVFQALEDACLTLDDIDCIISASGTMEQAIPYNGANLHRFLELKKPIPAFDINMTCLSAVAAIDVASALIENNSYKNILIVSSEIASVGIDWNDKEVGGMFGDGAAAIVIGESQQSSQQILASHFETYSEGYECCQIRGGGSRNHPRYAGSDDYAKLGMFEMNGKEAYRITAKVVPGFLDRLLTKVGMHLGEIDWVVPHQASYLALQHMQKKFAIPPEKLINILADYGNQIAASIPTALYELLKNRPVSKGDTVLIIGTSAGISVGGMILQL